MSDLIKDMDEFRRLTIAETKRTAALTEQLRRFFADGGDSDQQQ